jgi:hypothetical protein
MNSEIMVEKFINNGRDIGSLDNEFESHNEEKTISMLTKSEERIQSLLIDVQRLEEHLKNIQSKCRHTFFETSTSSLRKCLICNFEETICYRLPNNE